MAEKDSIKNTPVVDEDEIDLIELAKTIWNSRKVVIYVTLVFFLIGFVVAMLAPKQYKASTTMVPQLSTRWYGRNGISSLAAMAGFNLDLNMDYRELSPYVYPQIVQSAPFQLEIMNYPFTFSGIDHPVSLYEYYTEIATPGALSVIKKYTVGLPGLLLSVFRGKPAELPATSFQTEPAVLTPEQEAVRKIVDSNIILETNDQEGYVTLEATFPEPVLAAQVAQKAQELLQRYITEFKVKKAEAQLQFVKERLEEKKKEFEEAQSNLASFRDRNKNVTSALARTEEERLQNEYQLAFSVYSELARQYEQAQIKVKEETPVFVVVKPVVTPREKSKPNRPLILLIWTFMGAMISLGWIFGKQFLATLRERWNEETQDGN